jgi:hypothetical protein
MTTAFDLAIFAFGLALGVLSGYCWSLAERARLASTTADIGRRLTWYRLSHYARLKEYRTGRRANIV